MSQINTLENLLEEEIKDLYSAENQLVKALPKMAEAASDPDLSDAFNEHLEETKLHIQRLEEVAEILGIKTGGKSCKAMKGLIEEGSDTISEKGAAAIKDLALIVAAQKVEHYEISGYGSCKAIAARLGLDNVVGLLEETEDEEAATDAKLTEIAENLFEFADESEGME